MTLLCVPLSCADKVRMHKMKPIQKTARCNPSSRTLTRLLWRDVKGVERCPVGAPSPEHAIRLAFREQNENFNFNIHNGLVK